MKPFLVHKAIKRHKKRQAKRRVQYWHSPPYYTESIDIVGCFLASYWSEAARHTVETTMGEA